MKNATFVAAAAFAVAGLTLVPAQAANSSPTTNPSHLQAGDKTAIDASKNMSALDSEIQGVLATATDYALTPKHMTKLVSLFSDARRQAITTSATYSQGFGDKLNDKIESISKTWKQKYGNSFSISSDQNALSQSFASIRTEAPEYKNAAMESAFVEIQNPNGSAKLQVPLLCEKSNDWKIDVPASLTAEKLRDNLLAQLTDVNNHSAHWPANENDAYRLVARHVLAAVLDMPLPTHAQASAAPKQPAVNVAQQTPTTPAATVKPISATSTHHWYQFWNW